MSVLARRSRFLSFRACRDRVIFSGLAHPRSSADNDITARNLVKAHHAPHPENRGRSAVRHLPIRRWNKFNRCPLLPRSAIPEPPPDTDGEAMSAGFSDQLIAVLPRLRRFARGLTG